MRFAPIPLALVLWLSWASWARPADPPTERPKGRGAYHIQCGPFDGTRVDYAKGRFTRAGSSIKNPTTIWFDLDTSRAWLIVAPIFSGAGDYVGEATVTWLAADSITITEGSLTGATFYTLFPEPGVMLLSKHYLFSLAAASEDVQAEGFMVVGQCGKLTRVDDARVRRNVVRMLDQRAPKSEVIAYLADEGIAVDEPR
jgi:hypothetical protein